MYRNYLKNIIDIILSFFLFLLFFPIIVLIYFILLIQIGSPLFLQKRPGFKNKIFTLYKFKTIIDKQCKNYKKKKKFFKFGSLLRKTGLDELPQLLNVFKGDISLVGPRPLRIKYLKISSFRKHVRSKCKPGITGLAQLESYIAEKNSTNPSWQKNFRLDEFYYYNLSFTLDMKVLILTFFKFMKFSKKVDFTKASKLSKKHIN